MSADDTRAQIAALEAEARRVLAEVEPDDAARERRAHREERECGYVLLAITGTGRERGSRTIEGDAMWRPRATRTRSGWAIAGGWLDAAVPELPTRGVPNAGGVRPVIAQSGYNEGVAASMARHGHRWLAGWPDDGVLIPVTIEALCGGADRRAACNLSTVLPLDESGERRESAVNWHVDREAARRYPTLDASRGWCVKLARSPLDAVQGTARDWPAMQRACERVMLDTDSEWTEERAAIVAAQSREAT